MLIHRRFIGAAAGGCRTQMLAPIQVVDHLSNYFEIYSIAHGVLEARMHNSCKQHYQH